VRRCPGAGEARQAAEASEASSRASALAAGTAAALDVPHGALHRLWNGDVEPPLRTVVTD
jgi:hypothetical protein